MSTLASAYVWAATNLPTVERPQTSSPQVLEPDISTPIVVTAHVSGDSLIVASVNLLRIDGGGGTTTNFGAMHDDGLNGDAIANDNVYSLKLVLNERSEGTILLAASAAFKGSLRRTVSEPLALAVVRSTGLAGVDIAAENDAVVLGDVLGTPQSIYDETKRRVLTLVPLHVTKVVSGKAPNSIIVEFPGGSINNEVDYVSGYPSFTVNESVIMILKKSSSGSYFLPDGAVDVFHIKQAQSGVTLAVVDSAYNQAETARSYDSSFQLFLLKSAAGSISVNDLYAEFKLTH